jgi:uncharacterized protein
MGKHQLKILSIDGGGIRGIIPSTILAFIESQVGSISDKFELLAGTSTGGIISLGLTKPDERGKNAFTAQDMRDLYVTHGKSIFGGREKDTLSILGSLLGDTIKGIVANPYHNDDIENILVATFGTTRLAECKSNVLVTTYELQKGRTFYFQSRLAREKEDENLEVRHVARSTSAAPTYFMPSIVDVAGTDQAFIDGGVFANNPSILAYGEAKELWKRKKMNATKITETSSDRGFEAEVAADDEDLPFFMLSLGTGNSPHAISLEKAKNWRAVNWLEPLLSNIFMQSVAESTHFTMQHLLPPFIDGTARYKRLDLNIPPENSQMDDASDKNIEALCKIADTYVKDNKAELMAICKVLSQ